jgi:hypothetical protein
MDGGGTLLTSFERVYWMAFGGATVFLIGRNVYRYWPSKREVPVSLPPPSYILGVLFTFAFHLAECCSQHLLRMRGSSQMNEGAAARKDELALKLAMGEINMLQSDDVFEGLTPEVPTECMNTACVTISDTSVHSGLQWPCTAGQEIACTGTCRDSLHCTHLCCCRRS